MKRWIWKVTITVVVALGLGFGAAPSLRAQSLRTLPTEGSIGISIPSGESCGVVHWSADDTSEGGIAWSYHLPPYYGAWAECYTATGEVCAFRAGFTRINVPQFGVSADVYIWADDGGKPGAVQCVSTAWHPGDIGYWPEVTIVRKALQGCCVDGPFWIGYWGNWLTSLEDWFSAYDTNPATTGCPYTNIPPGVEGLPSGWHPVSTLGFNPTAMALGAEIRECSPTPSRSTTWGQVKRIVEPE